jgi:hypothetical protein
LLWNLTLFVWVSIRSIGPSCKHCILLELLLFKPLLMLTRNQQIWCCKVNHGFHTVLS